MKNFPTTIEYSGIKIIKVAGLGWRFKRWIRKRIVPVLKTETDPHGWAYYEDYLKFKRLKKIKT